MVSFAFFYIMCFGVVAVWVCVFSNLYAFMQGRSTEVGVSSVRWRIFAGMTIRHVVVSLYDMHALSLFCFCSASKWRTSTNIRGSRVRARTRGTISENIRGPEFGAGPENVNKAQVNGICTLYQVSVLCLQVNKKNRSPGAVLLQGRAGRQFCTVSNLFRQAENCYRFSDSPPPPMSQRHFSILQCLLSHCCRQLFSFCLWAGKYCRVAV